MPRKKLTQEYVSNLLRSKGSKLLSEYKGTKSKVKIKCAICGDSDFRGFNGLKRSNKILCHKCLRKKRGLSKTKYDLSWYKNKAKKVGSKVLCVDKLYCYYICKCERVCKSLKSSSWLNKVSIRCKACGLKAGSLNQKLKYNFKTLNERFENFGCSLITKEFKSVFSKVRFKCVCGDTGNIIIHNLDCGLIPRCKKCQIKNTPRGKKHYKWSFDLTDEERQMLSLRPQEIKAWYRKVYAFWDKTCVITGNKQNNNIKVSAHHLYGWNEFKDLRFEITNGVCILTALHKKFHKVYGYGYNTLNQFREFYKQETKGGNFNHVVNTYW